jgi:hypothetical protein
VTIFSGDKELPREPREEDYGLRRGVAHRIDGLSEKVGMIFWLPVLIWIITYNDMNNFAIVMFFPFLLFVSAFITFGFSFAIFFTLSFTVPIMIRSREYMSAHGVWYAESRRIIKAIEDDSKRNLDLLARFGALAEHAPHGMIPSTQLPAAAHELESALLSEGFRAAKRGDERTLQILRPAADLLADIVTPHEIEVFEAERALQVLVDRGDRNAVRALATFVASGAVQKILERSRTESIRIGRAFDDAVESGRRAADSRTQTARSTHVEPIPPGAR